MPLLRHISELITGRTRRRRTGTAVHRPTAAEQALDLQQGRVAAMQLAIDGRWQVGVATGMEMARWELTAGQASNHLTDVACHTGVPLTDVARVVVAEGLPNRE